MKWLVYIYHTSMKRMRELLIDTCFVLVILNCVFSLCYIAMKMKEKMKVVEYMETQTDIKELICSTHGV